MTIPHLLRKGQSGQDWRRPTHLGRRSFGAGHKKTAGNFNPSHRYPNSRRHKKGLTRKLLGVLAPLTVFFILLGAIFTVAMLAWVSRDLPNPDGVINRAITLSTKIYDRTGKTVLYDIHGNIKRTLINLNDIPDYVQKATLTAEDRNFYKHQGFSWTGIVRSLLKNIFTGSRAGGSTLTQQFVKNAILTKEKTYTRKFKEIILSYQLEKRFKKDQILQMYFNEIPYGSVIYGIEAAAQSFFGKSAKDLTVAEGAILAAMPQRPTYYSPYGNNLDKLIERQKYILDSMTELGYISRAEAEKAKQEKIIFKPLRESIIAPHFVMYVKELLSEKYGEDFITQEGLKVYTTLDLDKQKIAEKAVKDGVDLNSKKYDFTNASLVSLDPKTGQILALVGSADYFNQNIDGQVNVALRPRQPGSSFKPVVYTAAFIRGYTPNTVLYDAVTNFDTTGSNKYEPHNYNPKEYGPVTIRQALAGSLNIPAVKTTYLAGINNVLDLADEFGYTTLKDRSRFGLSLVLGGGEVKLLEHTSAFGVFAQEGIKHEINPILKIEDRDGRVLYEYTDKNKRVVEPEIARLTTDILSDDDARAYVFGKGGKLTLPDRPVAAKTGTTNDYRDAWTIGYTPSLVTGVWVGNNNNREMKKGADGSIIAAPIWNQYMREALRDTPPEQFTKPQTIITGKPILDGQLTPETKIKIDTMSGKLATQYTPDSTLKEIATKEVHDILYYINKDDPRGEPPKNPADDPQFNSWELSALRWAKEQGINPNGNQLIPTEFDDIHLEKDQPKLIIITPLPNQTIKDQFLVIEITASAPRGIKKIEYYLDNKLITAKTDMGDANLDLSDLDNGYHALTVKVKDDLENTKSQSVEINVLLAQKPVPTLNWLSPNNSTISFPAKLNASLNNWPQIKKIDFYFIKQGAGSNVEQFINYLEPSSANILLVWDKKPEAGSYIVYGNIFDQNGKKYKTEELKVIVK